MSLAAIFCVHFFEYLKIERCPGIFQKPRPELPAHPMGTEREPHNEYTDIIMRTALDWFAVKRGTKQVNC